MTEHDVWRYTVHRSMFVVRFRQIRRGVCGRYTCCDILETDSGPWEGQTFYVGVWWEGHPVRSFSAPTKEASERIDRYTDKQDIGDRSSAVQIRYSIHDR